MQSTEGLGRRAVALLAVVVLATIVGAYRLHHDRTVWSPDGPIYLRMTLQDLGRTPAEAERETDRYVLAETSLASDPSVRGFYGDAPPAYYRTQAALFTTRPLYPALGAVLYPRFGPFGLKMISVVGFVVGVALLFGLLVAFVPAWVAAIGAAVFALSPPVQDLAALPLTDELGLCFWVATLAALFAYLRAASPARLALLVLAAAALTFTRPAIYLPFGAALAVFLLAPRGGVLRAAAARATLALAAVGVAFGLYTLAVHGPGIGAQLAWQYDWQRAIGGPFTGRGFAGWWTFSVAAAFARELVVDAYKNNALLLIVLAAFGVAIARRSFVVAAAAGAAAASLIAILVNPLESARTVTVPLTPVLVMLAALALARIRTAPQ